jgi:transcriptional regulator with XRE-family HTH domain
MGDEWVRVIARLVEAESGNVRRTARKIGVPSQTVGRWLKGARPDPELIRKVADVTDHSLPYLMAAAYDIPLEEMADGVGRDVLPYDHQIKVRSLRKHISNQYIILTGGTPPDGDDETGPS